MPPLDTTILFLEDDALTIPQTFDRDIQSLIHQPGFEKIQGLVICKFQKNSQMTIDLLQEIISTKQELSDIPVIAEASFGHTTPQFTFPIGGRVTLQAFREKTSIKFTYQALNNELLNEVALLNNY